MKKYELDLVNFIRDKDNFSQWLWGYMFLGPSILIIILKYGFQMDIEFNFILYMTFFISTMVSSIYIFVFVIESNIKIVKINTYYEQYTLAYDSLFVISSSQVDSKSEAIDLSGIDDEKVTKMVSTYNRYKWYSYIIGLVAFFVCVFFQAHP
jgi:hypothetical protein